MIKKVLFKKKNYLKTYMTITLFLFFFVFLILFIFFQSKKFFNIPENFSKSFIVPDNYGGKKILNQDKKGLHLSSNYIEDVIIRNDIELKYSIQIYTNQSYDLVNKKRLSLINKNESIFLSNDLYVAQFNSILGKEFFLLYKNFHSRDNGLEFCKKYVHFVDNCLIVDVQNLD